MPNDTTDTTSPAGATIQPARPRPSDFRWIERFGRHIGSFDYAIRERQESAAHDGAPIDVFTYDLVYTSDVDGERRVWRTADSLSPQLRDELLARYP